MKVLRNVVPLPIETELQRFELRDGSKITVEEGKRFELRASNGLLIVSYSALTGKACIHAPSGVELQTRGTLEIGGADEVRIAARRRIELSAPERVVVRSEAASLELEGEKTELRSRKLQVTAEQGTISMREAIFAADRVSSAVQAARHFVGTIDMRAGRIVERATTVFREVAGLYQTRAERLRTVARGAFQLVAERATLRAEQDMTLMGEKIHLA